MLDIQSFQGFGSNFIKKAGFSPDAFVQIALQLAIYRLWEIPAATYEATQMRPFLHGRTETTRTVSQESVAFVKQMGLTPRNNNPNEKLKLLTLLQNAVQSHVKYISAAAKGNGVDRHFFGMSMIAADDMSLNVPRLYEDPLFNRAKTWRVSTSHLTHPNFDNWGFGEVVPHGVGVAYGVKPDSCIFNITARRDQDWTGRLSHLLEEALLEMKSLTDVSRTPSSKL